jgi:hypothetical protein
MIKNSTWSIQSQPTYSLVYFQFVWLTLPGVKPTSEDTEGCLYVCVFVYIFHI